MKQILLIVAGIVLVGVGIYAFTNKSDQTTDIDNGVITMNVASEQVDCLGEAPQKCLVINGEYFYDSIQGFTFEPGNEYVLRVRRTERANVPADASAYVYTLVETLSKKAVPQDIEDGTSEEEVATYCADLKANVEGSEDYVIMTDIAEGSQLESGDVVAGCVYAPNGSYAGWAPFEGQIGSYEIVASNGISLAVGPLSVPAENWMEKATAGEALKYQAPVTFSAGVFTEGTLILKNENASGEPENDKTVTIAVTF